MSKKFVRGICIVLCVLLIVGLIAYVLPTAFAVTQREIDQLEEERAQIRAAQTDLKEQIDALQGEISSVITRKAALDEQNELNRQDIELINEQIALYDEMISEKAVELDDARSAERAQYARYCERVRTMEEKNSWSYITMLLNASSLTDFLSRLNDVIDIVRNDQDVKAEYVAAREHVETVKAEYEEIQEGQQGKREELLTQKAALEKQIEDACAVIADLEEDIEKFEAAYTQNELLEGEVQQKIDEKVAELQKQKEAEARARAAYEAAQRAAAAATAAANRPSGTTAATGTSGYFTWPVPSCTYITSRFGYRVHPIFQTTKYHSGVDIAAGYGSAIQAAAGGTVSIAEKSDSYGYYCVIYHSNGTTTLYAHMNAMPLVTVGQTVTQGQLIGYVGSTGWSTGPHCHFEIRVNGSCVDPLSYYAGMSFSFSSDA
jgi:murein DD-endopeptidase MepM/ murein hydrolase activator NlpD